MTATSPGGDARPRLPGKLVQCILPDDGTDKKVLQAVRERLAIVSAHSMSCRSLALLTEVEPRRGKLPPSELARLVQIVVPGDAADAVFDLVFETAGLDRPGRGAVWQGPLLGCTPFALPEGLADEAV